MKVGDKVYCATFEPTRSGVTVTVGEATVKSIGKEITLNERVNAFGFGVRFPLTSKWFAPSPRVAVERLLADATERRDYYAEQVTTASAALAAIVSHERKTS
jgi:hypothetical protein